MPLYTNSTLVGAIIELDPTVDAGPFIDAAEDLVTEICVPVLTYSADRIQRIATWLSAHLYCMRTPQTVSEGTRGIRESFFENKPGFGLWLSRYGHQVALLDTNGGLAALSNTMTEVKTLLGKTRKRALYLGTDDCTSSL